MGAVIAVRVVEGVRNGGGDAHRFLDAELGLAVQLVPQSVSPSMNGIT